MNVIICSIPTEVPGTQLRRKRSEGLSGVVPKFAIISLNHWAVKNGLGACKFYDIDMLYPSDEEIEKYFSENQADVVGLSAVVSTSYMQVKRLAKIIKKINKKTLVICGGYLTAAANTVLKKTEVDICVVGNGEIAWVSILKFTEDHLLKKEKKKLDIDKLLEIKGIAVLDENRNLRFSGYGQTLPGSEMSFPDFEFLKSGLQGNNKALQNYFRPFWENEVFSLDSRSYEKNRKPMMVSIFSSKGCVAKCTFCQRGSKGYIVYDLGKLEKFLKHVIEKYNVGFIFLSDENFGTNKKYTYQCAELFQKYNLLWLAAGARCTSVAKEDVLHYKKNGCCGLTFGVESGSQTMLDIMEKKFTVDDIKKAIFACYDNDLWTSPIGFMFGMPGESLHTARESGKLLGEIAARVGVPPGLLFGHLDPCYAIPLIGTPLYEYGRRLGLVGQNVDEEEKFLELVSNVGAYKRYYINFNGAPISEVVFWDMLVFLEATRLFVKLTKNKTLSIKWEKRFKMVMNVRNLNNPHIRDKQKKIRIMGDIGEKEGLSFTRYFITNFLRRHVVFNKFLTKVPRFILYPIVRYLLYFEFLIQKYLLMDSHNLHKFTNKKVNSKIRIKYEDIDPTKTTQKDRSLRNIVMNKMKQNNKNKQEETLSLLTTGP